MTLLPQSLPDGSPNPAAVFLNAVLCSGLYHQDRRPFETYAAMIGAVVADFQSDPNSFNTDYGVVVRPGEALVVLDGTTNAPQWLSHMASAVFPLVDATTGNTVVGSFYLGLNVVEGSLLSAIRPATNGVVQLTGHSYGAAAAKLFADHLNVSGNPPSKLTLMTFGEPKSSGTFLGTPFPFAHAKIVASLPTHLKPDDALGLDPVSFLPPGVLQCLKWPLTSVVPLSLLGLKWKYFGQAWELRTGGEIKPLTCYDNFLVQFDPVGWLYIFENIKDALLHPMDLSYLPRAYNAWKMSGQNPELTALEGYAFEYINSPFVPANNLLPSVPAQTINASFLMPTGTVNDANRAEFATISASADVISGGVILMSAPVIAPTLKGTFFFDQEEGGSSQSFYAVAGTSNAPTTFGSMLNAMKTLGQYRSTLSQCEDQSPACRNPFQFSAIRVDDVRTKRKGTLDTSPQIAVQSYYGFGGSTPAVGWSNDQTDACYKATFQDDFGNFAQMYFHGVPIASQVLQPDVAKPVIRFESRRPQVQASWLTNLNNFCNRLRELGLGLRYTTVQWTPMGLPGGTPADPIASSGNGTPLTVEYGKTGTGPQTYTIGISVPVAPILGKFRVICREFAGLKVLNGRHPAVGYMSGGLYFVNIRFRAPNYLPWDNAGYISPEIFSVFQPNPAPPLNGTLVPGVSSVEYTTRKVGRPFGLARGRRAATIR